MEKLKLASSSLGERLKNSGEQVSRMVTTKMKEILQAPTPESKLVDEATSESLEDPNWGLNLRICGMINSEELSGTEIVKALKKKISTGKSVVSQRLGLELLETCTSNCEKVYSEVASEKLLEDMVRMIEDPKTDHANRDRASQMITSWGASEDLMYLPVFHQTYMSLKTRGTSAATQDGSFSPTDYNLESYAVNQQLISPPERYPIPDTGLHGADHMDFPHSYGSQSIEGNKEFLVTTRNSLDLLSSILNSLTEPKSIKDDLTVSMLDKCKQSLPVVQRIAEFTTDDEVMLFDALNLHDELEQVISRCEEMETALESPPLESPPQNSDTLKVNSRENAGNDSNSASGDTPMKVSSPKSAGNDNKSASADAPIEAGSSKSAENDAKGECGETPKMEGTHSGSEEIGKSRSEKKNIESCIDKKSS